jgi:excinuclease ABC subunit C
MGSYKRITEAATEDLAAIPGLGPELARQVHDQLHEKDRQTAE